MFSHHKASPACWGQGKVVHRGREVMAADCNPRSYVVLHPGARFESDRTRPGAELDTVGIDPWRPLKYLCVLLEPPGRFLGNDVPGFKALSLPDRPRCVRRSA